MTLSGRQSRYYYLDFANKEERLSNEDSIRIEEKSGILDHIDLALNSGSNTA